MIKANAKRYQPGDRQKQRGAQIRQMARMLQRIPEQMLRK